MKARLTMRAALVLGLSSVAMDIGRGRRWCRDLLDRAGHEAGRGNVVTATGLFVLYFVGL
ncbi:hypothetical protein [Methylobacterium sp. A54F]